MTKTAARADRIPLAALRRLSSVVVTALVLCLASPFASAAEQCSTAWKGVLNVHDDENGALRINRGTQVWETGDRVLGVNPTALNQQNNTACYEGDGNNPGADTACRSSERVQSFDDLGLLPARPNSNYTAADDVYVADGQTVTVNSDLNPREVTVEPGGTLIIEGDVTINVQRDFTIGTSGAAKRATVEVRGVSGQLTRVFAKNILYNEADLDVTAGSFRMINDQALRAESDSDLNCGAIQSLGNQRRCTDTDGDIFGISRSSGKFTNSRMRGAYYVDGTQFNMTSVVFQGAATGGGLKVDTSGGNAPGSDVTQGELPNTDGFCEQPGPGNALTTYRMEASTWSGQAGEVVDFTGNGHDATAAGDATTTDSDPAIAGDPGTCAYGSFDGDGDYVEDPDAGSYINGLTGITIMGWIRNSAFAFNNNGIFATTSPSGSDDNLGLRYDAISFATGQLRFSVLKASINTDQCADGSDCLQVETDSWLQTSGQWQHIALVWQSNDKITIYVNGVEVDTTVTNSGIGVHQGSIDSVDFLRVGQSEVAAANGWQGTIDEFMVFDGPLTALEIQDLMDETHPCPSLAQFSFDIGAGTASTCQPRAITLTAEDSNGNTNTGYTGTVDLTTSSGHGTWSVNTANGTLSDTTSDDGAASYTFDSADDGSVVLDLTNVHADDLTITATDSSAGVSSTSSTLSFRDNAFVVEPTDALGTEVVAGRGHGMKAELWRRDPSTGNCSIATGYAGSKGLKAWLTRTGSDPGGTAPTVGGTPLPDSAPGANNLSLSFSAGVANFTLDTTDVGQYAVNLRDDTSGFAQDTAGNARAIDGGSGDLTVRPFGLAIDNVIAGATPNPGADTPSGSIFTAAGASFAADVTAVAWQSGDDGNDDGVPDTGADLTDNATTLSYAWATGLTATAPFEPAAGSLGAINNGSLAAGDFTGGQATATGLQYTEVGSMTLQADATGYLGASGVAITGKSGVVGRFTPDHFDVTVNSPTFAPGCGTFTYLDQALSYATAPQLTITAKNALGGTTVNYYDFGTGADWWRLADINHATDVSYTDSGMPGAVSIDATGAGHSPAWDSPTSQGQLVTTFNGPLYYMRPTGSAVAPFNASMQGSVSVTDADGVSASSNPVTFTIGFDPNNPEQRHGRMSLANAHGSELLDLDVPVAVEYYAGGSTGFVTNADDGCTTLASGDVTLSNFQDGLSSGDTSVTSTSLSNGSGTVALSASDPATGSVDVTVDLSASSETWLRYDWDGDGTLDDPTARATFGIFNREEQWIYQRELY